MKVVLMAHFVATTRWPRLSSNFTVLSVAARTSGEGGLPAPPSITRPIRSRRFSGVVTNPTGFSCAPGPASSVSANIAAESRMLRLSTCSTPISETRTWSRVPTMRPRDGFSPNSPQQDAGMRIDPPPSLAWAKGTTPAAVAAAAPPDDPPEDRDRSQGFRVGPKPVGSVVGRKPYSGVEDLPITLTPARS